MKFSILQQDLLPAVQSVARSVGVRSTLPVLENILISSEKDKLKLSATNLEIGIIKDIACEVLEEGDITIPARTFLELLSNLGQIKLETSSVGELITIESANFKASLNGIAASEFPSIPTSSSGEIILPKQFIQDASQILFAAAVDEGRPVLTGVLSEVKDGELNLVATDGFRLAHKRVEVDKKSKPFRLLVPKKTYEELVRILSEEEIEEVSLATLPNQIVFKLGQTVVSSRLIEGSFPSWEKIIPTEIVSRVLIDKDIFSKAIKLSSVFAKGEAVSVLNLQKGGVLISSSTKEIGSQENKLDAQVEGDELQIAFNSKFLQEAVLAVPSTQLMLEFSGPLSAALIKPVGVEGLEYIVMPVRLS